VLAVVGQRGGFLDEPLLFGKEFEGLIDLDQAALEVTRELVGFGVSGVLESLGVADAIADEVDRAVAPSFPWGLSRRR
jgi:hypothetical protein